jgi:preprotein translocase subunit SecA
VDDGVPIQASIVSKIIEGSQTRVEGYNFDTRKHLLEYDDVLNSQRNKIYDQRDRIFEKDDLTDDFLEMVTAEVNRRVDLAQTDEEGRWKLFAWLEESQPSLPLGNGEFYPSYMLELMLRDLEEDAPADKRAALLNIARAALESEREHLMAAVEAQADRAEERLDAQIKEKKETAELALEELENAAEETGQAVEANRAYRVVSDTLGLQLRPTAEESRDFNYKQFKKQIPGWAEAAVSARVRSSLVLAIERRVGVSLGLTNVVKADADWEAVRQQLTAATDKAHRSKAERSLTEIERELKSLPDTPSRAQLTQTLISMAYGTVSAFDQKTHRKILLRTLRLTYVFLAAESVSEWQAAELKEEIIAHLRNAVDALRQMWGESEFRRIGSLRLSDVIPAVRERLRPALPADAPDSLTFNELSPEAGQTARQILGDQLLTQLFRQIMLQVISQLWVEHLTSVEALRTSIGLEAYAQRDPLVAYKAKASETFQQLLVNMRAGVVARAFTLRPRAQTEAPAQAARPSAPQGGNGGRAVKDARPAQKVTAGKTGAVLQQPSAPEPAAQPGGNPAEGEGKKKRRRR